MCTKQELSEIMSQLVHSTYSVLGNAVKEVILFGSYARNDADNASDIDVMILLDMPREQIASLRRAIAGIASELLCEHGIVVSPILESKAFFDRNRELYPFYRNIDQEGIRYVA